MTVAPGHRVQVNPRRLEASGNNGRDAMTVYVVEIKGRAVAVFNIDKAAEAEDLIRDPTFLDDLMVLQTGGLPLWDGVAEICVRHAHPEEDAKWRASRSKAVRDGNIDDHNDEMWLAFLVSLTDPDRRLLR